MVGLSPSSTNSSVLVTETDQLERTQNTTAILDFLSNVALKELTQPPFHLRVFDSVDEIDPSNTARAQVVSEG